MEKFETPTGEEAHIINEELATIFRLLSKPDAVKILYRTGLGIEKSTYAIEELDLTPKKYYYRLKELVAADLIKKVDGVYRQTALGRIIYDRFLPAMGKTYDAKDELELIVYLEGTELDDGARKRIEDELNIPSFAESTNVNAIDNYESMVVDVINVCDEADESILMASNYFDVRVMEATFRAIERGVINRLIIGKTSLSSKIKNLKMMLSLTFAKTIVSFTSDKVDLKELVRFTEIPVTFCIVDGHINIIELSNSFNEGFIVALSIDDRVIGGRLTKYFEMFWEAGEFNSALKLLNSIKSR